MVLVSVFFFVKQKTEYEMRISDWSSDVCSSDLTCTQRDDDREAVDQLKHQCAAPDNDGHAQQQAENDVKNLVIGDGVLCGARDGNHIVEAHHEIDRKRVV